jgi:flagellar capping protein FliD
MAQAIAKWFAQGGKTLWVTGDSDYSGGDYRRIPNTNKILEAVGSHLRNDNCEVVDPTLNAGRPYRPTALIQPSPELSILAGGVYHPVLFHGPGPIAIVYNGKWYPFFNDTKPPLPNIYKIAVTSKDATIHEFVKPFPKAYDVLNPPKKSFVLMAAEIFYDKGNIVLLSGDAPYDHYAGMYTDNYHGYKLSGKTFVKNVILWGVGLLGQRIPTIGKELISLQSTVQSLQSEVKSLQSKVSQYEDQIKNLQTQLSQAKSKEEQYKSQVQSLQNKVSQYEDQVKSLQNQVNKLNSEVSSLNTRQYVLLIVGIIIGLIIGAVIGFKAKK